MTDANDNRPMFEQESYSFTVPETAPPNQLIGVITAKDLDSGRFGTHGIRYSLTGAGSELFRVNDNGAITVAECRHPQTGHNTADNVQQREKRDTTMETEKPPANAKKVNLTIVGETGFIDVDDDDDATASTTELYYPYANVEEVTFRPYFSANDDYMVMSEDSDEETTTAHETAFAIDENHNNNHQHEHQHQHHHTHELNTIEARQQQHTQTTDAMKQSTVVRATEHHNHTDGPGHAPCLDYETQPVYFLTYKVRNFRTFILINFDEEIFVFSKCSFEIRGFKLMCCLGNGR